MKGLKTDLVRDERTLSALREDWWDLWQHTPSTPFQSPAWCLPWWRIFQPGELCTATCRRGDRLIALAPLYCERGPQHSRLLPLGIALGDYLDVLVNPEYPRAGDVLLSALNEAEDWDLCCLEELLPEAASLRLEIPEGCRDCLEPQSIAPVLPLPPSIERLREVMPAAKLRNLRNARRRAERCGELTIEGVERSQVSEFLESLFELHSARWNSRDEPGVVSDERVRRFHHAVAPLLLERGVARLYQVRVAGRVVAAYYGFCDRRRAYAYLSGFDPQRAHESPGTLVIGHAIEAAVAEGCGEFHFLRGQEAYKYQWGALDRSTSRRTFVREPAHV